TLTEQRSWGESALFFNQFADGNTAIGDVALAFNDSSGLGLGNNNTAVGAAALFNNVDGSDNAAVGVGALVNNVTGIQKEAMGNFALSSNVRGSFNVAMGESALNNAESVFNTAVGFNAGQNLVAGFENIYLGDT